MAQALHQDAQKCLVEIKLGALAFPVHLGSSTGPLLTFQALPYALADAERPDLR